MYVHICSATTGFTFDGLDAAYPRVLAQIDICYKQAQPKPSELYSTSKKDQNSRLIK